MGRRMSRGMGSRVGSSVGRVGSGGASSTASSTGSRVGSSAAELAARPARALLDAVARLYDRALDSVLASDHHVPDAHTALRLLDERHKESSALGEQIGKVAVLAVPVVKKLQSAGRFAKLPGVRRLPWLASATTVAGIATALSRGVHEIKVIGAFVASRLETVAASQGGMGTPNPAGSGLPSPSSSSQSVTAIDRELGTSPRVDPELVKRVTMQLYLSPGSPVRLDQRVGASRLLRRWLVRGALRRDSSRIAEKAVSAVSRLDVADLSRRWAATTR